MEPLSGVVPAAPEKPHACQAAEGKLGIHSFRAREEALWLTRDAFWARHRAGLLPPVGWHQYEERCEVLVVALCAGGFLPHSGYPQGR